MEDDDSCIKNILMGYSTEKEGEGYDSSDYIMSNYRVISEQ
jgi:hypothetical protein